MITDDRLKHMLGVARKCYKTAKDEGRSEEEARTYFVMGLLHDIGYEFADDPSEHPQVAYDILQNLSTKNFGVFRWNLIQKAIREHGNPDSKLLKDDCDKLRILNLSDMTVDNKGNSCSIDERIGNIACRYGIGSKEHIKACEMKTALQNLPQK